MNFNQKQNEFLQNAELSNITVIHGMPKNLRPLFIFTIEPFIL